MQRDASRVGCWAQSEQQQFQTLMASQRRLQQPLLCDVGWMARREQALLRVHTTHTSTRLHWCCWGTVAVLRPRPHCSAHGTLRRGPLFCRAGLQGRIPLSELNNILF